VYWVCRPGEARFQRADPPDGLNDRVLDLQPLTAGGIVAHGVNRLWVSDNGLTWRDARLT
jgi:hypothetical protein